MTDMWPKRIRDDERQGGGKLDMSEWYLVEPGEPLTREIVEEAFENTVEEHPPSLDANPNEERNDFKLTVSLDLGQDDSGLVWEFSLRRAIAAHAHYGEIDHMEDIQRSLWRVLAYTRAITEKMRELQGQHWQVYEDLAFDLDKEFSPQPKPPSPWMQQMVNLMVRDFLPHLFGKEPK